MAFAGLKVKTYAGAEFFLEYIGDSEYKIREAKCGMSQAILGKVVKKPILEMPLIIQLNSTDTLSSSRVREITKVYSKKEENAKLT